VFWIYILKKLSIARKSMYRNSKYRYCECFKRKLRQSRLSLSSFSFPILICRTRLLKLALLSSMYFLFLFLLIIRLRAHSRTIRKIYFCSSLDRQNEEKEKITETYLEQPQEIRTREKLWNEIMRINWS